MPFPLLFPGYGCSSCLSSMYEGTEKPGGTAGTLRPSPQTLCRSFIHCLTHELAAGKSKGQKHLAVGSLGFAAFHHQQRMPRDPQELDELCPAVSPAAPCPT